MASPIRPEITARMGPANAASVLITQVTSNPKTRYAVLFNEGPGYLLIDALGSGSNGDASLVSSLANHQTYVRKLHNALEVRTNDPADCPDVSYLPIQSHVPKLFSFRDYTQQIPPLRSVTYASIWQLCNGGDLGDLILIFSIDEDTTDRVPEAIIWHFLTTICETFLEVFQQGLVHNDVHGSNFVLHWPQNTPLPELFLIDFGNGARYPPVSDLGFRAPWTGNFDQDGKPISNYLSRAEEVDILTWYTTAFSDLQTAIDLLSQIKVKQHNGVDGPSLRLTQTIEAWDHFLSDAWMQPSQAGNGLNTLLSETRAQSSPIIQQFLARPRHAYRSIEWMRNVESRTQPAFWKDPRELFTPSEELDHEFVIQGGGMDGSVTLIEGQFRVVEVISDENTLQWSVTRVVNSTDDCASLSPDDDTQFDWGQFDNNARRNQNHRASGDDEEDDEEDDDDDKDGRPDLGAAHVPTPFIQQFAGRQPTLNASARPSRVYPDSESLENSDNDRIAFLAQLDSHRQLHQRNADVRRQPAHSRDIGDDNIISQRQRDLEARLAAVPRQPQLRLVLPAATSGVESEDFDNDPIAQRRRNFLAQQASRPQDSDSRSRSPRFGALGNNPRAQQRRDYQAQLNARRESSHQDASEDYDNDPIAQRQRIHDERLDERQQGHQRSPDARQHEDNPDSEDFDDDPIAQRRRIFLARMEAQYRNPQGNR